MANGQVDDLSWSQLRPRRTAPKSIIDSIPPEDMQAFLRLIATNPFLPFSEASTICSKIASVRQWRAEFANLNTVTYVAFIIVFASRFQCLNCAPLHSLCILYFYSTAFSPVPSFVHFASVLEALTLSYVALLFLLRPYHIAPVLSR